MGGGLKAAGINLRFPRKVFEVRSLKLPFITALSPRPAKCHNESTRPTALISKHDGPVLLPWLEAKQETKWPLNNSNNLSLHVNLARHRRSGCQDDS